MHLVASDSSSSSFHELFTGNVSDLFSNMSSMLELAPVTVVIFQSFSESTRCHLKWGLAMSEDFRISDFEPWELRSGFIQSSYRENVLLQNSVQMPDGLRCLFLSIVFERSVNLFKLGWRSPALGSYFGTYAMHLLINIPCGENIYHGLTNTTSLYFLLIYF